MPHSSTPHSPPRRIALLSDAGRAWKLDSLLPLLSHHDVSVLTTDALLRGDLTPRDLTRFDLIFIKTKEEPALCSLQDAASLGARLINTLPSIRLSKDRSLSIAAAQAAGVPVPRDFCGPLRDLPFPRCVIKSPIDHDDDSIPTAITDPSSLAAATASLGPDALIYAQEYVDSSWELKIYCIGTELFGFRQHPILVNPDKHASRQPFDVPPLLADLTLRTLRAVGLDVGGVDFLGSPDRPMMTDVNSTQGLQNFPQGYAALARFFERCLATP
jgi:glutathione synthase/RimK-type ligase-like ATP-grasp enzyme